MDALVYFTADYDAQTVTCPQGTLGVVAAGTQHGKAAIVATFSARDSVAPAPPAPSAPPSSKHAQRQLTLPPRDLPEAQVAAGLAKKTTRFQADYARRALRRGHDAPGHQPRRAARPLPRPAPTCAAHVYMACALNLLRLEAYWTSTALDRRRTSHLARLELGLAA